MEDLERITFHVPGHLIDDAKDAIDCLPENLLGTDHMMVNYDPDKKRCTLYPGNRHFSNPLSLPAGLDKIEVYSPEGQGMRGKIAFSCGDYNYVINPNRG